MTVWKSTKPLEEGARYVRKYLYLAMAAASVAVLAAPIAASATDAKASPAVLTISKAGGTAVRTKATLQTSLATGTSAVFSTSLFNLTCKSLSFSATVTKNPKAKGTAAESVTKQSVSKCTVSFPGVTVKSVTVDNLPYNATVSDAKGDPVTVSATKKNKPVETTVSVALGKTLYTCIYSITTLKGSASNKGNTISFSKQKFTSVKGSASLCPATATFAATLGPVKDSSVRHSPSVFVN
jgi:hypothetical protein